MAKVRVGPYRLDVSRRTGMSFAVRSGGDATPWPWREIVVPGIAAFVLSRTRTRQLPPNAWRVEVTVPLGLPLDMRTALFDAIADVVSDWEPADREGWDAFVSAHPVHDEFAGTPGTPREDL